MSSSLGEIDSERGVLDKVSPVLQFLRVRGLRFLRAKARDRSLNLLRKKDSPER